MYVEIVCVCKKMKLVMGVYVRILKLVGVCVYKSIEIDGCVYVR